MKKKGMTLEQVLAAKPTRDYDPRWGAATGFWTTRHVRRGRVHKSRREGNALIMIRFLAAALLLSAPAFAQMDFSGSWAPLYHEDLPDRIPGPELGDYLGLPLNDAARLRADSYDADRISVVPEYQCRPHSADYSMRGLANMRVDVIRDPVTQRVVAFHTRINFQEMERTIWLDGRPHPSEYAPHTWQGFSTGTWDDNMLDIYTTHLKESYLKRNGVPRSDKATFTEHWVRHGDYLTVATVVTDPGLHDRTAGADSNLGPGSRASDRQGHLRNRRGNAQGRRLRAQSLARNKSLFARGGGLVRIALRSNAGRRGNAVSRVSEEDGQAGASSRSLRALLLLRRRRPGLSESHFCAAKR